MQLAGPAPVNRFGESFADWPALDWGFITEWWFFPFKADESLSYFLKNVGSLKPVTLLMIGVGALIAFWIGRDAGFAGLSSAEACTPKPEPAAAETGSESGESRPSFRTVSGYNS